MTLTIPLSLSVYLLPIEMHQQRHMPPHRDPRLTPDAMQSGGRNYLTLCSLPSTAIANY